MRRGRPNEKTAKNPKRKHLNSAQEVTDEELDVTGQHSPSVIPNQTGESNSVADESLTNEGLRQTTQAEVRMARQSEEEQLIAQKEQELVQISTEKEQKAKQYAKENPDLAAELIKVWMKDK